MTDGESPGEQVFLVPIDRANFEHTVVSPVDLSEYSDRPAALPGDDRVRLWGAADGTRSVDTYERMEPGDLLLFYAGGTYVGVGRVGLTVEDESGWASETLWEGTAMNHLFSVTDFASVDIPREAVNSLFEYGPDYSPGGLMRVAPDRVTASLPAIELAVRRFDEERT